MFGILCLAKKPPKRKPLQTETNICDKSTAMNGSNVIDQHLSINNMVQLTGVAVDMVGCWTAKKMRANDLRNAIVFFKTKEALSTISYLSCQKVFI